MESYLGQTHPDDVGKPLVGDDVSYKCSNPECDFKGAYHHEGINLGIDYIRYRSCLKCGHQLIYTKIVRR